MRERQQTEESSDLQKLGCHDQGTARTELSHSLDANCHDSRAGAVMDELVDQLAQHWLQDIRWHLIMARLHTMCRLCMPTDAWPQQCA